MNALFLLVPLGVLVVAGAAAVLVWAIGNGQFEDLESAAAEALADDPPPVAPASADPP